MASNQYSLNLIAASSQYAYREDADCTDLGESGGSAPTLFSAWVKPVDDLHYVICAKTKGFDEFSNMPDGGYEFLLQRRDTEIIVPKIVVFHFSGTNYTGYKLEPTTGGFAEDEWHHVGVFLHMTSGTTVNARFYIDGEFLETVSALVPNITPYSPSTNRFTVGAVLATDDNVYGYFDGQIDELYVDRPGSTSAADANIAANFRKCTAPGTSHWRFDNDLTDDTANANDLTGVNTPTYSTPAFTCFVPTMGLIL